MKYSLDLGFWDSVFVVPQVLVKKYINFADLKQIKALLWILSNKEIDAEKASVALNLTSKEFEESFNYWQNLGFFSINKESILKTPEKKPIPGIVEFNPQRPDTSYVVSRIKESDELSSVMKEAQIAFRRPLSRGDVSTLLMLHDNEGLPMDVILMLIRHCVDVGKGNMRYIYKVGISWAESGIDSIEKAERKIEHLNKSNALWKRFQNLLGLEYRLPTPTEESIVVRWYQDWHFKDELIKYSYEICIDAKGKYIIKYMDSILRKWYNQGIFNLDDAKECRNNFKSKNSKTQNISYSIEEYEKYDVLYDN